MSLYNHLSYLICQIKELHYGCPPPEPCSIAFPASLSLIKCKIPVFVYREAGLFEELYINLDRGLAVLAEGSDQPLGKYTVQRGNKVVRLYVHVDEPSYYVKDIDCVHRGKYKVTRKRGLNCYLGGLCVSYLANHYLVRVMPQDGTESPCEGKSLLFIDRHLDYPAKLVLRRVFYRYYLVLPCPYLGKGGVKGSCFLAACGSCNKDHPVRLPYHLPDPYQFPLAETEDVQPQLMELLGDRLLVKYADHSILAKDRGHDGDPEVY